MSWSRRALPATVLAIALPLVSACGFRPVYGTAGVAAAGPGSAGEAAAPVVRLSQVAIDPIPDRTGQILRNLLIDRFYTDGRPGNPAYRLAIQLQSAEEELGIRKDATATRARLRVMANYELIDTRSGQVVYRTFSRAVSSYNILEQQYGALVSQQDAYQRALTELANDVRTRLALYFAREPMATPAP